MKHQILIASYHKDFPWLRHCLRSLTKFSTGFLPPVIAVPREDLVEASKLVFYAKSDAIVKMWEGPGFGRAQDAMMSGDILCPDADYYWLLGSDCIAVKPFTPADYCDPSGKPIMLYHSWDFLSHHCPPVMFWRDGVRKALGWTPEVETMRRLPLAYPKHLPGQVRDHIAVRHDCRFQPYVWNAVNVEKNFSESNVMGEWAYHHRDPAYAWRCLDGVPWGAGFGEGQSPYIVQCWSHGGFDRPHDSLKITPREIITTALGTF